ncbi:MAG: hypothetical protein ACXVNN_08670, partial [Bacteroidia bacterium]
RVTAIACLASMLLCYKLWLNERPFPLSPVFDFLPTFHHPVDFILLGLVSTLLILISIFRNPQKYIIAFLFLALTLALFDQNRWQPWFYQYVLMFFVVSFFNFRCDDIKHQNAIVTIFKLMIGAVYFWSGLQKLNPNFLTDTFPWLMEPITDHMKANSIDHFKLLGHLFPLIETGAGIGLFIKPIQKISSGLIIFMHLFILFVVGPFGHNYNPVVWPWNIAMMFFVLILFYKKESFNPEFIRSMFRYHSLKVVTILFVMMPLFNFFNLWDSYLSNNLYSGNTANGIIYVSDNVKAKLPEEIKQYAIGQMNQNQITIKYWCMQELGVPAYPEKRNFAAVTKTFYKYAKDSSEIYLMFTPKLKLINL